MLDMKSIGQRYTQVRKSLNLTQEELAEKVTGESNNYVISRLEAGKITNIEALANYADALGTPLEYFICGINFSNKNIKNSEQKLKYKKTQRDITKINLKRHSKNWLFGEDRTGKHIVKSDSTPANFLILGKNKDSIIKPNIFRSIERGEQIIVSEEDAEFVREIETKAKRSGYKTLTINLSKDGEHDYQFDILSLLSSEDSLDEDKVSQFVSIILENSRFYSDEDAKFYKHAEEGLIKALIYWLKILSIEEPTIYKFNVQSLINLIKNFSQREYNEKLFCRKSSLPEKLIKLEELSTKNLGAFISTSNNVKDSIKISALADITLYNSNCFSYIEPEEFYNTISDDEKLLISIIPNKNKDKDVSTVYVRQLLDILLSARDKRINDQTNTISVLSVYINNISFRDLKVMNASVLSTLTRRRNCSLIFSSDSDLLIDDLTKNKDFFQHLFANIQYCMVVSGMKKELQDFLSSNSPIYIASDKRHLSLTAPEDTLLITPLSILKIFTPSQY